MRVDQRDKRCVMVTIDPVTLRRNPEILRAVARERDNRLGVYGSTVEPAGSRWAIRSNSTPRMRPPRKYLSGSKTTARASSGRCAAGGSRSRRSAPPRPPARLDRYRSRRAEGAPPSPTTLSCGCSAGNCGQTTLSLRPKQPLLPVAYQADPCQVPGGPCKNLHGSQVRAPRPRSPVRGRRNPCRDVAVPVAPAPAQNVRRVFTAPPVDDLGCHLEVLAMLAPCFDQRTEVVDELGGRVVSDVRRAGEGFMVYRTTRGDRPGQAGRGRALALLEIGVNPHDVGRAAARREPGDLPGGLRWRRCRWPR